MSEGRILESWKAIAAYLGHSARTCRKWEKEFGLPVHRLDDSSRAHVFAYAEELDRWKTEKLRAEKSRKSCPRILGLRWTYVLIILAVVLLAMGLAFSRRLLRHGQIIDSIAILPLDNLTGNPEQGYFVDAMTEALIAELAQLSSLRVTSRTSAMTFRGVHKPVAEIARALNVKAIIEGSVVRSSDRVKISVQLIQANPEKHLWAKQFTHTVRDILNLPEEAARDIVGEIQLRLTPEEKLRLRNAQAVDAEAHELALKGRYLLDQFTERSLWNSIDYFRRAAEKDPAYAPAYCGLAEAYMSLVTFGFLPPLEGQPKGREHVLKAMELDETLAEPHVGLAWDKMFYARDWEGAEKEYQRALELNPNSRDGHEFYAIFLAYRKRFEEAFFHMEKAREIDPLNLVLRVNLAWIYKLSGQLDKAFGEITEVLGLAPNFPAAHRYLGLFHIEKKDYEKAIAELEKGLSLIGETAWIKGPLGYVYALAGKKEKGRQILEELKALSKTKYVSSFYPALIHVGLEEMDQAFDYFERAYQENDRELVDMNDWPGLDQVRLDPRFAAFVKKIGLS